MTKYAAKTGVGSDKSKAEIEKILSRYGATSFMYGWSGSNAVIGFEARNRRIRFILPMPSRGSQEFTHSASRGIERSAPAAEAAYEQAIRQRWRALVLIIKAKLEAVESSITTFEDEFLAHTVLPGGETVGEWMKPQLQIAYQSGNMPPLLGHGK